MWSFILVWELGIFAPFVLCSWCFLLLLRVLLVFLFFSIVSASSFTGFQLARCRLCTGGGPHLGPGRDVCLRLSRCIPTVSSTMDTFSSVPGGIVFDGEYDETVSALVHRKCFCQTSGISVQQCYKVTDGSHFRATVFDGDRRLTFQSNSFISRPTTTLTGVAPSCARLRAHRFYLGTCR